MPNTVSTLTAEGDWQILVAIETVDVTVLADADVWDETFAGIVRPGECDQWTVSVEDDGNPQGTSYLLTRIVA